MKRRDFLKGLIAIAGIPLVNKLSFADDIPTTCGGFTLGSSKSVSVDGYQVASCVFDGVDSVLQVTSLVHKDGTLYFRGSKNIMGYNERHDEETRGKVTAYLNSL